MIFIETMDCRELTWPSRSIDQRGKDEKWS